MEVWGKGNCNVSLSAEGTATHEAVVTAADCPNSRLREVDLSFQFCSTGKCTRVGTLTLRLPD